MKLKKVQIDNSLRTKIFEKLLKQCGFKDSIIVNAEDCQLPSPNQHPRAGWEDAFKKMSERSDDATVY